MDEDDVAEVDGGLPAVQPVGADAGQTDHHLQLRSIALLKGGEAQLSGVSGEHHPTGHADVLSGGGVGHQIRVGGTDLGQ